MKTMNTKVNCCTFTGFYNFIVKLLLNLCNDFLNTCWMNSSVSHKLMECKTANFSSYRIKSRNDNCLRCVINNNFHTSSSLQCTYVTSFPSYNPSFHLVVFYMENADRVLNGCFCCHSLNSLDYYFLCLLVCIQLSLIYNLIDIACCISLCLILKALYQTVLCLFCAKS